MCEIIEGILKTQHINVKCLLIIIFILLDIVFNLLQAIHEKRKILVKIIFTSYGHFHFSSFSHKLTLQNKSANH